MTPEEQADEDAWIDAAVAAMRMPEQSVIDRLARLLNMEKLWIELERAS